MAVFLTPDWLQELNGQARQIPKKVGFHQILTISYRVYKLDEELIDYHVIIKDGVPEFFWGLPNSSGPIIKIRYDDAVAIFKGEKSLDELIRSGKVKLGGDVRSLLNGSDALDQLTDVFEKVRRTTTFEDDPKGVENPMEVLSSRVLLRPTNLERSLAFYGGDLGLAVYREFGVGKEKGVVFFLGGGFLELSGRSGTPAGPNVSLWLQVRNVEEAYKYLVSRGVLVSKKPRLEPWGLKEMWVNDPDGVRLYIVEVPEGHPLRSNIAG